MVAYLGHFSLNPELSQFIVPKLIWPSSGTFQHHHQLSTSKDTASCLLGQLDTHQRASLCGQLEFVLRTSLIAPGGALSRVTASFGNPRGTDGPSGGGALAKGFAFEEPRFLPTRLFLEQRPDPNSFHLKPFQHTAPPELSYPSPSARKADHFGHRPPDPVPRTSPDSASYPDALVNLMPATERRGPSQNVILKKGKREGKTVGQRESTAPTQGIRPVVDDAHPSSPRSSSTLRAQEDEVVDYGGGGSDSPTDDRQVPDYAALTIMSIQHLFKILSLPEKFRILGLCNVEVPSPFPTSLAACSTVEGRKPGMSKLVIRFGDVCPTPHQQGVAMPRISLITGQASRSHLNVPQLPSHPKYRRLRHQNQM